ncbi:regulatory protein RecX [Thalassotalea insulae]|uniref:Regulatory protein RecX n=1 Tax=Thalassotalea insulae TaxID=2056778 RepID=A0ABQ6GYH5_9GAMM|nr:regulatory protein RecX [Thalassotalea insulae]GLX79637.1 regulatory protein RecX [Thalassotalea insulae]
MNKTILHTAIDLLSRREHSVKEIVNKLRQRAYAQEEIEQVIEYLLSNNYLCEQRFAESVFRSRINKGYGKRYIENELKQKGLASALISETEEHAAIDWYELAQQSYHKKFGSSAIKDEKDKAKRIRFLQYRGFSTDEIFAAINMDEYLD